MNEPSLLIICVTAFVVVMLLLSLLAGVIRILMAVFPVAEGDGIDAPVLAAVHAAAAAAFPGSRVTGVEEIR